MNSLPQIDLVNDSLNKEIRDCLRDLDSEEKKKGNLEN